VISITFRPKSTSTKYILVLFCAGKPYLQWKWVKP